MTNEAIVSINGTTLNPAQSMTLRVAVGSFLMNLCNDGLGEDDTLMENLYKARCHEILNLIHGME